ncbi:MAG: hypothetical protein H7Y41_05600 [Hyphomonadaceae bacterium]|nr:hypothetical protein [Clostridia bacterium]
MGKNSVRYLTRTALLLALTLLFQIQLKNMLGPGLHTQFIVGSMVNLGILVAVGMVDVSSGMLIGAITPFFAGLAMPQIMIPVAIGNMLIAGIFGLYVEREPWVGLIAGAAAKAVGLYFVVNFWIIPYYGGQFKAPIRDAMAFSFSWPQFVTAMIGGSIAIYLIRTLKKVLQTKLEK